MWEPLPGPQSTAQVSDADEILYGGAAGGGKSDWLLGMALTQHTRAIIFRRQYVQLSGLVERSREIVAGLGQFNGQEMRWRIQRAGRERTLRFGAVDGPEDWQKFQGRAHDLVGFDELAHFTEHQYRMLSGWARTTDPEQRVRIIAASNPPATAEGQWIRERWAPWVDPTHPTPAASGEVRWFVTIDEQEREVADGTPIVHDGRTLTPRSRTFIQARVTDNPYLLATGYVATLEALPEPMRSMFRDGDFTIGIEDDEWQVIPTAWVLMAQQRWRNRQWADDPLTHLGVDVARGGRDMTILAPRSGTYVDDLVVWPGSATPDGPDLAAKVFSYLVEQDSLSALVHIDAVGVGASPYDFLKKMPNLRVKGAIGSARALGKDETHLSRYMNQRAHYWWHLRELLDPKNGKDIALPDDAKLRADLCAPRWIPRAGGVIQVETKAEIIKRLGRSPDRGDAVVLALAPVGRVDRHAARPVVMGGGVEVGGRDRLRAPQGAGVRRATPVRMG